MPAETETAAARRSAEKRKKWWISRPFFAVSIGIHVFFVVGATYFVVSRSSFNHKLTFAAGPRSPNHSERALEHRVQVQQKTLSKTILAAVPKRVLSSGPAKVELPPMPSLAAPDQPVPAPLMAAAGQGLAFTGPAGNGSPGGTGKGAEINFFGIRDTSSSVVIMIDVSDSMFTRTGDAQGRSLVKHGREQSFQAVRDEAIKLIESLGPNISFGIIRWSGGAYSWKPELMPATAENKEAAIAHIQDEVDMKTARPRKDRPGGTRHDYALEEAFLLKPETIYMLTDGNATAAQPGGGLRSIPPEDLFKVTEAGQRALSKPAKLHVIYYLNGKEKPNERQMLMSLATRNNGRFITVSARGRGG